MPAKIPMALFLSSFDPGGTERQMIELMRRLDHDRFDVHLACFRRRGAWLGRAEECATSVAEFPISGFGKTATVAQARRFARWCREHGLAIVHTGDLYANIFGLPAAAFAGVPVRIGNRRELNPDKSAAQIAVQRAAYGCAHAVVANSRAAAVRLAAERVPSKRVHVVPNGIDPGAYEPREHDGPIRRIVTVANLRPEKAHDVLIEAAVLVLKRYPDAEFICAGGGPRRTALETLARVRGGADRVRFTRHCEDIPRLLPGGDRPSSGLIGDLFVDSDNRLWFCKGGTSWKQLA